MIRHLRPLKPRLQRVEVSFLIILDGVVRCGARQRLGASSIIVIAIKVPSSVVPDHPHCPSTPRVCRPNSKGFPRQTSIRTANGLNSICAPQDTILRNSQTLCVDSAACRSATYPKRCAPLPRSSCICSCGWPSRTSLRKMLQLCSHRTRVPVRPV